MQAIELPRLVLRAGSIDGMQIVFALMFVLTRAVGRRELGTMSST